VIRKLRTAAKLGIAGSLEVVRDKLKARVSRALSDTTTRLTAHWTTYHRRPLFAKDVGTWSDLPGDVLAGITIVIQGPVLPQHDFTLESIKIYQRLFPGVPIIVSTWDDTDPGVLAELSALGVVVVLSSTPAYRGYGNVNFQIVSTVAGLRRARELGCTWAVKTRTDQRIHSPTSLGFLQSLLQTFPAPAALPSRIVVTGITRKYKLYHLSDMFHFGHVDSLLAYWDAPHDTRRFAATEMSQDASSFKRISRVGVCESYLFRSFLGRLGECPADTLEDSWRMIAKYAIVIDRESLDLFWPKYRAAREYRDRTYRGIALSQEISFSEWLLFHTGVFDRRPSDHDRLALTPGGLIQRDAPV
jgi:hypothetical protein